MLSFWVVGKKKKVGKISKCHLLQMAREKGDNETERREV